MAKNAVTTKKVQEKKHFTTPTDTWWGKALVWIIFFGMVGLVIVSFIFTIIYSNA